MNGAIGMRERILDVARRLVQSRGYDGFSYADIAEAVGIRKASIHHHFATKGDLGLALIGEFRAACRSAFAAIDRDVSGPSRKLDAYVRLFEATLADGGRMCLCGMLAAGQATLPEAVRGLVVEALSDHEAWLSGVLRAGRKAGQVRADASPRKQARALLAGLEGAMMLARAHIDRQSRFRSVAATLLAGVRAGSQAVA